MKKNVIYKYDIEFNGFIGEPVQVEYIENIYSVFWGQRVFIVINPISDINIFLDKDVLIRFHVDGKYISEYIFVKKINFINDMYIIFYECLDEYDDIFSFSKNIYMSNNNKSVRIWKNYNNIEIKKYLYAMLCLERIDYFDKDKNIIINGRSINGCYDFYCELGFLMNEGRWGYFAWNLDALADSLININKNLNITWLNYKYSRSIIDEDAKKTTRFGQSFMYDNYTECLYEILKEYTTIKRYD